MSDLDAEDSLSDEELAARCAARDSSPAQRKLAIMAFEEVYRRHSGKLLGFLSARVPRSDLEDLNQMIWKRVWEHLPTGFQGGNFRAWLHQIARNLIIDHARKKSMGTLGDADVDLSTVSDRPGDALLEQERMEILQRCLARLEEELQLLVRARLSGESYVDVCARLNLQPERAHKMFHEARGRLTTCVERSIS